MSGDTGPYMNEEGDVWVPRTVPYLEARGIARTATEYGQRLRYVGKEDAELLGFSRDCRCDGVCEADRNEDGERIGDEPCSVPAWHFTLYDR